LLERLKDKRGATTRFFVFADTVKARRFTKRGRFARWLGIRFKPGPGPSRPRSSFTSACWTKKTCSSRKRSGSSASNLIYSALSLHGKETLIPALLDNLTRDRVEVDMIKVFRRRV